MSTVQVSYVALTPERARSVPVTFALSAVVQVSWVQLSPAQVPVAHVFTAVLGSPLTQPGSILLGAPLEAGALVAFGEAVGLLGEAQGHAYVIGPFVGGPGGGTEIRPGGPVPQPIPIYARGRATGLLAQVKGRGRVKQPVRLDILVTAWQGEAEATGQVLQPVVLAAAVRAPLSGSQAHGWVIRPVHAGGTAVGRLSRSRLRAEVIEPAVGVGSAYGRGVTVQMSGKVLWLLEREEMWLLGLDLELEEDLVGV